MLLWVKKVRIESPCARPNLCQAEKCQKTYARSYFDLRIATQAAKRSEATRNAPQFDARIYMVVHLKCASARPNLCVQKKK